MSLVEVIEQSAPARPLAEPDLRLFPRLLALDPSPIASHSASGQFKGMLFGDWPTAKVMQVAAGQGAALALYNGIGSVPEHYNNVENLIAKIEDFRPDVIYCRVDPMDYGRRHFIASVRVLDKIRIAAVLHIMDDWYGHMVSTTPACERSLSLLTDYLMWRCARHFTDGQAYVDDFRQRYGIVFDNLLNGIDMDIWRRAAAAAPRFPVFTVTHMGNFEDNMSRQAIIDIAEVVEDLADEIDIRLEVHVRDYSLETARRALGAFSRTIVREQSPSVSDYIDTLCASDLNLYAYNMDPVSETYIGKGIPNKTCEVLAAARPVLAYGSANLACIRYARDNGLAHMVMERSPRLLREAILSAYTSRGQPNPVVARALAWVGQHHDQTQTRERFRKALFDVSKQGFPNLMMGADMSPLLGVRVDEVAVVERLAKVTGRKDAVRIFVAAKDGETDGPTDSEDWKSFCLEPQTDHGSMPAALERFCTENAITGIDVIRIAGGLDPQSMLSSQPWGRLAPNAIVCEAVGGTAVRDLAHLLTSRGYHVFGSEWHRADVADQCAAWKRLVSCTPDTACVMGNSGNWISLLCFRDAVSEAELLQAVAGAMWLDTVLARDEFDLATAPPGSPHAEAKTAVDGALRSSDRQSVEAPVVAMTNPQSRPALGASPQSDRAVLLNIAGIEDRSAGMRSVGSEEPPGGPNRARQLRKLLADFGRHAVDRIGSATSTSLSIPLVGIATAVAGLLLSVGIRQLAVPMELPLVIGAASLLAFAISVGSSFALTQEHRLQQIIRPGLQSLASRVLTVAGVARILAPLLNWAMLPLAANAVAVWAEPPLLWPSVLFWAAAGAGLCSAAALHFTRQQFHSALGEEVARLDRSVSSIGRTSAQRIADLEDTVERRDGLEVLVDRCSDLESTTRWLVEAVAQRATDLESATERLAGLEPMAQRVAALEERLAGLEPMAQRVAALETMSTRLVQVEGEVEVLAERDSEAQRRSGRLAKFISNKPTFQVFARKLGDSQQARIREQWGPALGIALKDEQLAYFAHRVDKIEDACIGRLATEVETAVIRALTVWSLKVERPHILEIGTLFGVGLAAIYDLCRYRFEDMHLTVVDPLNGYYAVGTMDVLTSMPITPEVLEANLARVGVPRSAYTIIQGMSEDPRSISEAASKSYDVLIIDGDHSEEGVRRDFECYVPFVNVGGYIIFDDYDVEEYPGIQYYVDELLRIDRRVRLVGSSSRIAVVQVVERYPPLSIVRA